MINRFASTERAAALLVTLAPLVYFFSAVRGRLVLCPDDGVIFNLPLRMAFARIVADGHAPLWNPYLFGGMPLFGSAQGGLLLPLNWFFLVFSAPVAMNLMMLATFALAGLGAFLYARRSGASVAGAIVTGLVWQWSGFLVAQIGHTNIIHVASLLPWLLWTIDGYAATGRSTRGVMVAVVVALMVFAGHPQTLSYSLMLAGAYAIYNARTTPRPDDRRPFFLSLLLIAAGLALAAVQILPTLELMRNSVRAAASYEFFTSFSLPPAFLLTFVAPYVLGGGDGTLFRAPYTGAAFYGEYIAYVGVAPLALAVIAPLVRFDARTKFWCIVALICFALALGRFWPFDLYQLIYYVPVLNLFRVPARHLLEVDFALAVLAGRAITTVQSVERRRSTVRIVAGVGLAVFALTCLTVTVLRPADFQLGRTAPVSFLRAPELFLPVVVAALSAWMLIRFARGRRGAVVLLVALVVLDLSLWGQASGWRVKSPTANGALWQTPPTVTFFRERVGDAAGRFRVLTLAAPFDPDAAPVLSESASEKFVLAVQPNTYMMHGVENAAGYDGFGLARQSRLAGDMKLWGDFTDAGRSLLASRELDVLNVRYLFAPAPDAARGSDDTRAVASSTESLPPLERRGGYDFAAQNLDAPNLEDGTGFEFSTPRVEANRVALLTNLAWSIDVPDGTTVGRVRLRAADGRTFDFDLRAGAHTSEWAHERPDLKPHIRHKLAPVGTTFNVEDPAGNYEGHAFVAGFALPVRGGATITGGEVRVARVEGAPRLSLTVHRVSLIDEQTGSTVPLRKEWLGKAVSDAEPASSTPTATTTTTRWRRVEQRGDVVIYENTRVLPRAWLAAEVSTQPDEATLGIVRTGKFPDGREWQPERTALLDAPLEWRRTGVDEARRAEITRYEPNRIDVRTESTEAAVLVLSENHYPGWQTSVDGRAVETLRVDYNLRGVALAPGAHEIRFVYRPKSALFGLLVSLLAAAGLVAWWKGWPERLFVRARHHAATTIRE